MTKTRRTVIGGATATIAGCALAATAFVSPTAAAVLTPNIIEPTPGETQLNLIGINDFHGRILDGEDYAATVLTAQQGFTEANSLVFTVGDHVGASIFESSILNDEPAINILNEMGVDAFTQGNHEFDKGAADAIDRIAPLTDGPDLAANFVGPDGTKPFDEYAIFEVNGVNVAIIGAVTQETPALVSPDGIAGYTFTDPVEAVNEVADRLTASGEADVIVASYHEGAPFSNVSLEENVAASNVFNDIVNGTSPAVSAIYTAHSHRTYAYDAPIPGSEQTRPVVQGGEYAGNIAQVVLTVDAENTVTAADSSIVPTMDAADAPAEVAVDPRLANIRAIIDQAVADADEAGSVQIGTLTDDVTRAKVYDETGAITVEDDRANASSLGDVVATSMLESVGGTGRAVDLAVMNPGGLRADLINDDGVLTYKDAATVLPFANNLSVATVAGDTLKQILEQQWQTDAEGNVPSRPYLQLGISDGFTYTYDASRPEGDRITGMYLFGEAVTAEGTYNVVAPTFLAAGGDNFRAFTNASEVADTGLIDLDAFVSWIQSQEDGVAPNQQRNSFEVAGFPSEPIACGDSATFQVSKTDMGSLGAIQNTELTATAYVEDQAGEATTVEVGTATVTDGAAELVVTIPADFLTDTFEIVLEAQPSGSYVILPIEVTCDDDGGVVPSPTETVDVPDTTTPPPAAGGDDDLAATGEDSNVMFFGIAAALAALVLGGTLLLVRRRAMVE
ncbi:hypothetical protein GCM10011490_23320 [Pseudoclavibacter endophyticus]|uniref:Bifunctional metallophosphatase/5'-nucleotidase n=1 Tax=Pseudoclavibacter endophyticus TaxID=1778590 RepID=A0A6H9WLF7_9MICO|nr:bifunctional UDP-sugar hydrolase/5'-nucleotidase [Pseudoclavibacter endophyticus]KAB1648352.1 bifunctional metallophosphatase/5'-nucleotidase [Pseudoclavibacter endophyticus]GGA71909.1 hypothetical protein GCM10011490_23320 [Pseudoclavibacter endophyticus]